MRHYTLLAALLFIGSAIFPQLAPSPKELRAQNDPPIYLESPTFNVDFPSSVTTPTRTLQVRREVVCTDGTCSVVNIPVITPPNVVMYSYPTVVPSNMARTFYSRNDTTLVRGQPLRNLGRRLFGCRRCQ